MIAANSVSSGVSCVPPPCGRTLDGGISGFAISHRPSGTIQLHVPRPITRSTTPHHIGHGLTGPGADRSRIRLLGTQRVPGPSADRVCRAEGTHPGTRGLPGGGTAGEGGPVRTDSTHVLASVRTLNRLEHIGEIIRAALNALAMAAPPWLAGWMPPDWADR